MTQNPIWSMFPENWQQTEAPVTFMEMFMDKQRSLVQQVIEEKLIEGGVDVTRGFNVSIESTLTEQGTWQHHYYHNDVPLAVVTFNHKGIILYTEWKEK